MDTTPNWKTNRIKRNHEKLLQSAALEKQAEREVPVHVTKSEAQHSRDDARAVIITMKPHCSGS